MLAVCVVSCALVPVLNVAVRVVLENVPLETGALRTVTAPELAFTPPVVAVHWRFRRVPVRAAMKVALVAVVLVNALVAAPAASRNSVEEAVAVPVPTADSTTDGDAMPLAAVFSSSMPTLA